VRILGRGLTALEQDNFSKYLSLLLTWQKAHRLVGSADPMWIVEHLFLDSLLFLKVLPSSVRSMADLGSGAGLPGLPIKIVRPDLEVVLIESRRRRAAFLAAVVRTLKISGLRVLEARAEELLADNRAGRFDAVVMRCAGDIEEMVPPAAGLLSERGVVIAAGPPEPRPTAVAEWVVVPGVSRGTTRRFAVHRKAPRMDRC
jgi:16S rRNA (guanine527-N7)-methyltransferase